MFGLLSCYEDEKKPKHFLQTFEWNENDERLKKLQHINQEINSRGWDIKENAEDKLAWTFHGETSDYNFINSSPC